MRQVEASNPPPDRNAMRFDPILIAYLFNKLVDCQIAGLPEPSVNPSRYRRELPVPGAALRLRLQRARLPLQLYHAVHELD